MISRYSAPCGFVLLGILMSCGTGSVGPSIGYFITRNLFAINKAAFEGTSVIDACIMYIYLMVGAAAIVFFCKGIGQSCWTYFSSILTYNIRKSLYSNVLRKHMSWHDEAENSPGVISAILASDAQKLNGITSEPVSHMSEAFFSVATGIVLGFYFSWPIALCVLCLIPLLMIATVIKNKVQTARFFNVVEQGDENSISKKAQLLASDSIVNYKTVASLGNDNMITDDFFGKIKTLEL